MAAPETRDIQKFVAHVAISPSTLRNQGAACMGKVARRFLEKIDLTPYSAASESDFQRQLERDTEKLRKKFPRGGQHWGSARKALNVFLRDAYYNYYLRNEFHLQKSEEYYEIPLDSKTVSALRNEPAAKRKLRGWTSIKGLKPEVNKRFQKVARKEADKKGLARVHMDAILWAQPEKNAGSL